MSAATVLVALAIGIAFGAVLQRVHASSPDRIVRTLALEDLTILKFMILAIGVTSIGIGGLTALGLGHLNIKPLAVLAVALGGLVFGVGFAVGGYCPGTCLVGAAEGRRDALFTIAGGLLGALAYALVFPEAKPALVDRLNFGKATLASVTGVAPGWMGIAFGTLMVVVSLALPTHPRLVRLRLGRGAPAQLER